MSRLRALGHQSMFDDPTAVLPPCITGHLPAPGVFRLWSLMAFSCTFWLVDPVIRTSIRWQFLTVTALVGGCVTARGRHSFTAGFVKAPCVQVLALFNF